MKRRTHVQPHTVCSWPVKAHLNAVKSCQISSKKCQTKLDKDYNWPLFLADLESVAVAVILWHVNDGLHNLCGRGTLVVLVLLLDLSPFFFPTKIY